MSYSHRSRRQIRKHGRARRLLSEQLEDRRLLAGVGSGGDGFSGPLTLDPGDYEPQTLLVRFRDDLCSTSSCSVMAQIPLPMDANIERGFDLLPSLRKVALPDHVSVEAALDLLQGRDAVLYAEPNYRIQVSAVPDDPRFGELWGLNNEGQSGGTIDADIDAPEAWDAVVGSGETVVAVIDTGVDYQHPDLAANMWVNPGEIPGDHIDNDGNGFVDDVYGYDFANNDSDPMDDHNHGTHVAGTIAAVGNNGVGVTGVNWNARIMALKFLNSQGSGDTDDAIDALNYAVANGAMISNNSWGFSGSFSQSLYDAIAAARDADHVFVAAAGNGNIFGFGINNDVNPFYPASYDLDNIISVAAVDRNDNKPLFSNYGATTVDLAAPGVDILSTIRNGGYGLSTGTSMASPHVAGVVALVRDVHPDWSYARTINQVLQTVDPISAMSGITTTGGRLNAAAAVGIEIEPAPEIQVEWESQNIADDSGVVDYGSTPPGQSIDYTYTIKNRGVLPLHLVEPILVPSGFSVTASFGTTTLEVGATTTFAIRLDADVEGTHAGEVSFQNDDPDENPFNFTVTGTVAIPPAVQVLDDGDAAFAAIGEWTQWPGQGYDGDVHESYAGSGADQAIWSFQRLLPGTYRVAATWTDYTNRATNAPFTLLDSDTALATVRVNQQVGPTGFSDAGVSWQYLGGPYTITSNSLVVMLSDAADGRVNADAVRIERIDPLPEVEVVYQNQLIEDGASSVTFDTTTVGLPVTRMFEVRNLGGEVLTLGETIDVPVGFSVVAGFGATSLGTDESTTFTIQMDANAAGDYAGVISFATNDDDENPFDFTLQGTVEQPPAVQILDNGDDGFGTVGTWTRWTGQGYENDIHESLPGSGSSVASWVFSNLLPGYYRVAATWTTHSNRASNAPFQLLDGAATRAVVPVNQQVSPNDFVDAGASWELLGGSLLIESGTLVVQLSDAADGRLNADAIRIERMPDAPEIEVSDGGTTIIDGSGTVEFGNTPPGVPVTRTITVRNVGTVPLNLDEPITVPAGFSLASGFGSTMLPPGVETSFELQFDALGGGSSSGLVSFTSDDDDESPFEFTVSGAVSDPPAIQIIDNGDQAFTAVGEWTRWTGQGYENDVHESLPGSGVDVASWTFAGLLPGTYRVAATWKEYSNRASNAPFTILDGNVALTTIYVNQRLAPNGFNDAGGTWQNLGGTYQITGNSLIVRLNDAADGRLNADAIRIERLEPVPEIQVTQDFAEVEDGVSVVDFGSTSFGAAVSRSFTVRNLGGEALHLGEQISLPSGFSLVSGFSKTTLATDEIATFVVQLDASGTGTVSGELSFDNDDADESPFNFVLRGTVLTPPSVLIVDNGDAGFVSVGEWTRWTGQGYLGDIHESRPGTGADIAVWSFTNLLPGEYRVSATWTAYTNRATNAPFTILDGANSLATILVNQRQAPQGFSDAGVTWNDLGDTYQVTSGTLAVQLSDAADGRLNADAIRIERMAAPAGAAGFNDGGQDPVAFFGAQTPLGEDTGGSRPEADDDWIERENVAVQRDQYEIGYGTSPVQSGRDIATIIPPHGSIIEWSDLEDLLDDLVSERAGDTPLLRRAGDAD